jgi:alpha-D-ribose 1-methylphosphonate 5-triphosphate synthase subunit PhnG
MLMDDRASSNPSVTPRQRWMSILARARSDELQALLGECGAIPSHTMVRGPEGGLVMVRARAGGGGAAFNLGEMTITRCTVLTETGFVGHAYVTGRDERCAELAALGDALMQDPDLADTIECRVGAPLERQQIEGRAARSRKAAATRVEFFAMQTMRT